MLKLSELWQVLESEARPVQMKGGPGGWCWSYQSCGRKPVFSPKSPKWQEMVVVREKGRVDGITWFWPFSHRPLLRNSGTWLKQNTWSTHHLTQLAPCEVLPVHIWEQKWGVTCTHVEKWGLACTQLKKWGGNTCTQLKRWGTQPVHFCKKSGGTCTHLRVRPCTEVR